MARQVNVCSFFDGTGTGRLALEGVNVRVNSYYASEIDKYAMAISAYNFPDIVQLGDIRNVQTTGMPKIDLILGGFPCQPYSFAGKREGLGDERGMTLVDAMFSLIKELRPKDVFLENVMGLLSQDNGDTLKYLLKELNNCGYAVDWLVVNSALVSAQSRKRVYILGKRLDSLVGTNYPEYIVNIKKTSKGHRRPCRGDMGIDILVFDSYMPLPKDKGLVIKDIVEEEDTVDAKYYIKNPKFGFNGSDVGSSSRSMDILTLVKRGHGFNKGGVFPAGKHGTLRACSNVNEFLGVNGGLRRFTPVECERLQTLPDNYTAKGIMDGTEVSISNTQRYRALGNGWTAEVIEQFLKHILVDGGQDER